MVFGLVEERFCEASARVGETQREIDPISRHRYSATNRNNVIGALHSPLRHHTFRDLSNLGGQDISALRIAIDATAAARPDRTGIPHYTMRLVEALREACNIEDTLAVGCRLSRWKNRQHRFLPQGLPHFWMQPPLWPPFPAADLVHGTDAWVPNWRRAARLATIHDLAVLLYPGVSSDNFRKRKLAEYQRLSQLCHRLISVSQSTKDDFVEMFDFPAERIDVVHHGISEDFFPRDASSIRGVREQYQLPQQYLLFVGRVSFRKNTARFLEAFAQSGVGKDLPLVWVGTMSYGHQELLPMIQSLDLENQVHFLGYVPQPEIPLILSGASALLYPTNYEGFGIPVLEAMRSGVPVLSSTRGSVPEVANGHALLVDPESVEEIAQGIREVIGLDQTQKAAAKSHAETFTWELCAKRTYSAYQNALQMR